MLGTTQPKLGLGIKILHYFNIVNFKHEASFKQHLRTQTHSQFVSFLQAEK